jgi:hypothetical protein
VTFLPIVDRELRVRARWRSTYVVRAVLAVFAISVSTVMMIAMSVGGPGAVGKPMLLTLGWLTFAFCCVEGIRNTADCLSEEKREGTLGLLFLTDLRGWDVVLGKFAATSLSSFYGVLAVVPTLALPVLLGGVTGGEFWRVVLVLLNTLFFSLTAGMFISALSRDERGAWVGTAALVVVPVALFPFATHASPWLKPLLLLSPTTGMEFGMQPDYAKNAALFWQSFATVNFVSWLFLALASFILPRVWRDHGARTVKKRGMIARAIHEPERRRELLALNPVWWLTTRNTHQRVWLWIAVLGAGAIGAFVWKVGGGTSRVGWVLFGYAALVHLLINVWVASEACYSFADARSTGAMELLLSTPLHVRQIVGGQQKAIKEFFFGPVLLLVCMDALLVFAQVHAVSPGGGASFQAFFVVLLAGFSIAWFIADMFAVSRVGMWFALTSSKPTAALTKTILAVLVLPALFAPCCSFMAGGLMLAKSIIFMTWAQNKLDTEFRKAAAGRFESGRADWTKPSPPPLTMPR